MVWHGRLHSRTETGTVMKLADHASRDTHRLPLPGRRVVNP
jgi:hypothetical protein